VHKTLHFPYTRGKKKKEVLYSDKMVMSQCLVCARRGKSSAPGGK
jgi:hypothetical protein